MPSRPRPALPASTHSCDFNDTPQLERIDRAQRRV
jgi:hypothetical protein